MTKRGGILARFLFAVVYVLWINLAPGCAGCGTVRALLRPPPPPAQSEALVYQARIDLVGKFSNAPRGEHYALTTPGDGLSQPIVIIRGYAPDTP